MALMTQAEGGYAFLPTSPQAPFSGGAVALPGHEIVRATLHTLLPWRDAFALIERYLQGLGRPRAALCAVELRCSAPYSREAFGAFNTQYRALLDSWGIIVDGLCPAARSNVAPAILPPAEQSLYAFHYTVPKAGAGSASTFFLSGAAERPDLRVGETSEAALHEKAADVLGNLEGRLAQVPASWDHVTNVTVYTPHVVQAIFEARILQSVGNAARNGLHWFLSRPPVQGLEIEIDARRTQTALHLTAS
jgi:enamine deaminase RidA (YjgF/YER057c/UK114 family)